MSDVKSKNLYELLGNTSDQDSDREPEPPTKAIEKPAARSGKRDAPKAAPVAASDSNARGGANRRAGGFTGNEAAFRDRTTGRNFNREKQTEDGETGVHTGRDSGPGTRRAGRGPRGPRRGGDRHSRTGLAEHQKQTDQAWGGATGEGEWADEKAGEAIAKEEVKEDGFGTNVEAPVDGEGKPAVEEAEPEPEDNHKSYADYLAEQAAKKLEGLGLKEARQANEGSKENKKWASAKALSKEDEEAYFAGQEKARRERERTSKKEILDIDYSFKEPPRDARGGARGGRGGRGGRGEFRGDRGDRGGRGRGSFGGDRGDRGDRGRGRGGRGRGGADGATVALNDEAAFPSLGA